MFRGFILGIVVTVVVAVAVGYILLTSGAVPANADGQPLPFERYFARTSLRATMRKEAPTQDNPVPLTDANLIQGIQLYGPRCAVCHGLADKKPTAISKGELPKPPILAGHGVEDDPEGATFWKIKHGIRWTGMPAWGAALNDQQIWTLALFLAHMDKLPPAAQAAWTALRAPAEAGSSSAASSNGSGGP